MPLPAMPSDGVSEALAASSGFALIGLDPQGEIRHWNAGAARIFGYDAADILGRSLIDLLPPPAGNAEPLLASRLGRAAALGEAPVENWHVAKGGRRVWASGAIIPQPGAAGFLCVLRDNTAFMAERSHQAQVLAGMPYRLHNLFATLQAVASQSLVFSGADNFRSAFGSRVAALGRACDALSEGGWDAVPLSALIHAIAAPYGRDRQLSTGGPALRLKADVIATFALMLRELADNAATHGAWSRPEGCVSVYWSVTPAERGRVVEVVWREFNGPAVTWPSRQGFGMLMLHRCALPGGGTTELQFHAAGVECRLRLPAAPGVVELPPGRRAAAPAG